jgi:hypothetical protein
MGSRSGDGWWGIFADLVGWRRRRRNGQCGWGTMDRWIDGYGGGVRKLPEEKTDFPPPWHSLRLIPDLL